MSSFRSFRVLCVGAVLAVTVSVQRGSTAVPSRRPSEQSPRLVVQNYYYAKPGKAEEVYRWRLHASEVRAGLGLARGRVLKRVRLSDDPVDSTDLPDVVWECEYADRAARDADLARLDASGQFVPVERHMEGLIRQFRRPIFEMPD